MRQMRYLILPIFLISMILPGTPAWGTSLFDEEGCELFTCHKASNIGDLVTIIISESTQATNRATTETDKSLNTDGELTVTGFLQWVAGLPEKISPIEDLTFTPSESFSGEGRVQTQGVFTARITATVIDALPNGNLVLEGTRDIKIAEDTASLTIRGVCNARDITLDNTILSSKISDMEILYEGEGIIAERQRDGILSRIFNFFF